jgi:hypothetical protein
MQMRSRAITAVSLDPVEAVGRRLMGYVERGVLRGLSGAESKRRGVRAFHLVWFHHRVFELRVTPARRSICMPVLLPGVPASSAMYRAFRRFQRSRQCGDLPEHRLIPAARCALRSRNRAGAVELSLTVVDGDYDYATAALIRFVNEVFLVFLRDAPYRRYMVDVWGLNPDREQF